MKFELQTDTGSVYMEKDQLVMRDIINMAVSVGIEPTKRSQQIIGEPYNENEKTEKALNLKPVEGYPRHYGQSPKHPGHPAAYEPWEGKDPTPAKSDIKEPGPRKTVELRGSEHQTGFDIADVAKFEMSEDVERVTAKIVCPDCDNITIDKVFPWFKFMKCKACDTKVYIKDDRSKPNHKYGDTRFFSKEEREEFKTEIKQEEPNTPTEWKPAPEDVYDASTDTISKYVDVGLAETKNENEKIETLQGFTIPSLKLYAFEKDINLNGKTLKDDIIKEILGGLEEREK